MKIIVLNRKANHLYNLLTKYIAGISLLGSEVKSIKINKTNFENAFISFTNGNLFIKNWQVPKYEFAKNFGHEEKRDRQLLLHKQEILKIFYQMKKHKNYLLIPTALFLNKKGLIKIEFAIATPIKKFDKRQKEKDKEHKKELYNF